MNKLNETLWLRPDSVFDGAKLFSDMAISIEQGRCASLLPIARVPEGAKVTPIAGTVTPGYVDLQVNGGGGQLLNAEPTAQAMRQIAEAHRAFGTVAILPTVITDRPDVLEAAAQAAIEACGQNGIIGLHIEGPHISLARNGTHAPEFVRPMDQPTLDIVRRLRDHEIPVMITLAPEAATNTQISELAEMGAVVSLGHSDVSAAGAKAAFDAGASCVTHLFNAMSAMQNREPGLTGAAINAPVCAGIIVDGIHVADEMVALAFRAKVGGGMFLVSDAMPTVGGPDSFDLYGQRIRLQDNRLINSAGSLAGAHTTLADCVARLVGVLGLRLETALQAAITVPARLMGAGLDRIGGRHCDDLLVLDDGHKPLRTLTAQLKASANT